MTDILSWIRLPGPFLVGHRGLPGRVRENTPASFEAALEAGCDGVELDVRITSDEVPVVHHDASAPGEDGPVEIAGIPWPLLSGLRFGGPEAPWRIHGLAGVLAGLAGRCLINVEVKPPERGRTAETAAAVHTVLETVRPRESVLVSSFHPGVLEALHRRDRSLLLGFLFSEVRALNHLEEEPVVEALTSLHPRHDLVDARLVRRAHERGLQVHAWTVDEAEEARRLSALGVTALITNRPDQSVCFLQADIPPG